LSRKSTVSENPRRVSAKDRWSKHGLKVFAAIPFRMVRRKIGFLRRNALGAEIMLYDTNWICSCPTEKVKELASLLHEADIEITAHGPIHDLNLGSLDMVVRDYTRHCYFKTLAICHLLGAKGLVLHLGINPLLPENALSSWLEESIRAWKPVVALAEQLGITIRLENMFISSPRFLTNLRKGMNSNAVKICFDIGHFNVYSKMPLQYWLNEIDSEMDEVHLNDNMGKEDEHLALGKGIIDFKTFMEELAARRINPQFTIEMKSERFDDSLDYLIRNDSFAPFRSE